MNRNPVGFPPRAASPAFVAACVAILTLIIVAAVSFTSLIVLLDHGSVALWIILAATGLGLRLVDALGLGPMESRWRWMAATALGIGALSLLLLCLGSMGFLQRPFWVTLLILFTLGGAWRLRRQPTKEEPPTMSTSPGSLHWLWIAAAIFAGLTLLAATLPPGILWPAEGNGYDVLEYHLGAPREYFETGRIVYLPHNIYSNFPFNVEMLYLLSMVLHGGAVPAAMTAQILHAFLGMLAVAGVWLAGREMGRGAGIVAGVMAAVCPFLSYLGALAYNECGLLFFSAISLAALIRSARAGDSRTSRWLYLAGLCAGFAGGCKYTGVPATFIPLAFAAVWLALRQGRPSRAFAFVAAALIAVSPWLIKNLVYTGNPFFPLVRNVFHERVGVWDDDGAARWHEGHRPAPEDRPLLARLRRTGSEVLSSPMFGPVMGLSMVAEIARRVLRRRRFSDDPSNSAAVVSSTICCGMILFGLAVWMGFTHLVDRFAVVLLIPVCVLLGGAMEAIRPFLRSWVIPVVVIAAASLNLKSLLVIFADAHVFELAASRNEFGSAWMTSGLWPHTSHVPLLNGFTTLDKKVLMVGDARRFYLNTGVDYCVVFNRNPFADAAASLTPEELISWLRDRGYSYVYVDWGEMSRLRRSRYGFWKSIDDELFLRLNGKGLRVKSGVWIDESRRSSGTIFEVPERSME